MDRDARADLLEIYRHAVAAVNGRVRVRAHLAGREPGAPVRVIAVGKAAGPMALGACDALGAGVESALVITKYGHAAAGFPAGLPLTVIEAGHPLPDANSLRAGRDLLDFIARAPAASAFLFLVSGGASALVEAPAGALQLADLQRAHRWLTGCGRDIAAINRVRTRLSLIKGGRLAMHLGGRRTLQLLISDVAGDDPAVIGSGLLSPADTSGPPERGLPAWLAELAGGAPAPPAADAPCFRTVETRLIACARDARLAAAGHARELGYAVRLHHGLITGDAAGEGRRLARVLRDDGTVLHIWSGETVVTLPETPGRGGRCQQLALAAAAELAGLPGRVLLAAGTDGGDGPGLAAGALVDGGTVARGQARGLDPLDCLRRADAGAFLEASGDLIHTGASGTNVMDLLLAWNGAG
ncbi:MAG: glycerate kinase [Gammaproteobacteria bacterium]